MRPEKSKTREAGPGSVEQLEVTTDEVILAKNPAIATGYDRITILRHTTSVLAKTWKADGSIEPYGGGKFFLHREAELSGMQDLAELLTKLNDDRRACVIRGVYVGDEDAARLDPEYQAGRVRRIADLYDDVPHHWMLVEIDDFEPLCYDPVAEPESAIDEYVQECLPSCFTGVSYFWQLSNSAGSEKNRGKLKAHVWFWLATAYTSEQLKAWATQFNVPLDRSVFNVVQVHYTSAPIFDEGVADPVPVRYGFAPGVLADEVALDLDATILAIPPTKRATRHSHMAGVVESDPVAVRLNELGMVKSVGKTGELRIECPRKDHHTGESSETSTLYYPAHTNGYANGAFKCMHDHCRDVPQREFLKALGFDTAQDIFEGLAETPAALEVLDLDALFNDVALTEEDVSKMAEAEFLIENMIVRGSLSVFVAPANGGKTTLFIHLCEEMAADGVRIFYINADASPSDLKRHHGHAVEHGYIVLAPDAKVGKGPKDIIAKLQRINQSTGDLSNVVIILDTLKKFTEMINKNQLRAFLALLRGISTKGATVIMLAHTNKYAGLDGKHIFEGTADLRNDVDHLIYLEGGKDEGKRRQEITTRPDKVRANFKPVSYWIDLDSRKVTRSAEVIPVMTDDDRRVVELAKEQIGLGVVVQNHLVRRIHEACDVGDKKIRAILKKFSYGESRVFDITPGANNASLYSIRGGPVADVFCDLSAHDPEEALV